MILLLNTERGISDTFIKSLSQLDKGRYLVMIHSLEHTTVTSMRKYYFTLCTQVSDHTGDNKDTIHKRFKKHKGVDSTKHFEVKDWREFIDSFKDYIFYNLDLLL